MGWSMSTDVTRRVTVVDLNPAYLRRLVERFPDPGFELDARCADLADSGFEADAFDLVHAALVLEYVDWPALLPRLAMTLRPRGVLSVVLQIPSTANPAVTPTEFTSLRSLESLFRDSSSPARSAMRRVASGSHRATGGRSRCPAGRHSRSGDS
jgi:trans-aconitate methyltransferase